MLAQNGHYKVNSSRYYGSYHGRSQGNMVDVWLKSTNIFHEVARSPVERFNLNYCRIWCTYKSEDIDNDLYRLMFKS